MEEVRCVTCGKELKASEEGKNWRSCYFCKKPVCFEHLHYIGIWREGLFDRYVEVLPVCKACKPEKIG